MGRLFLATMAVPSIVVSVMVVVLLIRFYPLLKSHSLWELLAGLDWHPQNGLFGFYPFMVGTIWVTLIAMLLSVPPSLLSAIFLAEYAHKKTRNWMKPLLDILAGIPSVVYGVWGMVAIVPWVRESAAPLLNKWLGFMPLFALKNPTGFSVLAGGIVLAVMVTPVITSVTYEVLDAVPKDLREASLALGATRMQTILRAVLRKAASGVLAAIVLGFSRAFGETMAVLMVVGSVSKVPSSIFDAAYPLTALIANNYGEMMSIPLYDSALMGAALVLLIIVMIFNLFSAFILQRATRKGTGQ